MKIYYHGKASKHRLFVQPGVDHPEVSDWMEKDDKGNPKAKMFDVMFDNYVATVPDNLGQYLVKKGYASKTKIILPAEVA